MLTSPSRKRRATTDTSAKPLQSAFSKKSTNVLSSVNGMLSKTAENTIKSVNTKKNKPVHLSFKGTKGRPPMMNVVQVLDPETNFGYPPKDLAEEWAKNHCLLSFLGWILTLPKRQLLLCTVISTIMCKSIDWFLYGGNTGI